MQAPCEFLFIRNYKKHIFHASFFIVMHIRREDFISLHRRPRIAAETYCYEELF